MNGTNWVLALWISLFPVEETRLTECHKTCVASPMGEQLVMHFEGYSPYPYKDAAGYPTIGYGHLITPTSRYSIPLLPDEAKKLLRSDLKKASKGVNRQVNVPLAQHRADAVISFTFNLGEGALQKSTLRKRINANRHEDVPNELSKWVYADGKKLTGLVRRRQAEAVLYMAPQQ